MKQIVHNKVKNPNWSEANQLAVAVVVEDLNSGLPRTNPGSGHSGTWTRGLRIQVRRSRIWTRDYREQIQLAVRAGLERGTCRMQFQRSNHWAKLPSSFSNVISITDGKSMVPSENLVRYLVQLKL